jgi:hypothetical protein
MAIRTSEMTITFRRSFTLPSINGRQPAGTYRLVVDDHETPEKPFVALRRIATHLHTPALSMTPDAGQVFSIGATELSAAVKEDAVPVAVLHAGTTGIRL